MIDYWKQVSTGDAYKLITVGSFIPVTGDFKPCYVFESLNNGLITIIEFGDPNWKSDHNFIPELGD